MISPHDLQILSSTSLFAGFSEGALRALCAALRPSVAELPRGRVLWRMGEQVTQAGIVLSGRVGRAAHRRRQPRLFPLACVAACALRGGRRRGLCAAAGKSAPRGFGKILAIAAARPVFVHSGWAAEAGVLSLRAGRRGFPAPHFPGTDGPAARHESRGALAPAWPAPGRGASALGAGAFCDPAAGGGACDCGGWMI